MNFHLTRRRPFLFLIMTLMQRHLLLLSIMFCILILVFLKGVIYALMLFNLLNLGHYLLRSFYLDGILSLKAN